MVVLRTVLVRMTRKHSDVIFSSLGIVILWGGGSRLMSPAVTKEFRWISGAVYNLEKGNEWARDGTLGGPCDTLHTRPYHSLAAHCLCCSNPEYCLTSSSQSTNDHRRSLCVILNSFTAQWFLTSILGNLTSE